MIYITGDTHGEQARFFDRMLLSNGGLSRNDYLIICGDFGYIFKDDTAERLFLDDLEKVPYTILFVDGNHENFPAIYEYPVIEWHGGKVHQIRKNILHLMRGEIFDIDGKIFFAMGGAYSIDKYMRVFCKPFLHKIAKSFCRLLHLHFVGNCKTSADSYSASHKPLQIIFSCYNTRYGNGSSEFLSSCACSLK